MRTIVIPAMGSYTPVICQAVNRVLDRADVSIRLQGPPKTTKGTVLRGWQLMDENMCLPAKVTLGNYLDALDQGHVDGLAGWDSCGTCRFKVYHILHQSILRRHGYDLPMYGVSLSRRGIQACRRMGLSLWVIAKAINATFRAIEDYDQKGVLRRQANLTGKGPRVGICGEIYTILDPTSNQDLLKRLEKAGAQCHVNFPLTAFLCAHVGADRPFIERLRAITPFLFIHPWRVPAYLRGLKRPDVDHKLLRRARKEANRYLPYYDLGGHGRESIVWSIYYALAGFDGVVHVQPFVCLPESTVSTLLDRVSEDYDIPLVHLTFDAQFAEAHLQTRVEALVNILRLRRQLREERNRSLHEALIPQAAAGLFLGVDVGSVSTKAVVINGDMEIVAETYLPTARNPVRAVGLCLKQISNQIGRRPVRAVGVTGSGRHLAAAMLGTDTVADEISCQALGVLTYAPGARSIIEIGGQDSKLIQLDSRGVPVWYNMNTICSAGTGSFLTGAAREFGVPIEEMGPVALVCSEEVRIAGRCGVFAESDVVTKQQQGHSVPALIRGLCFALPRNYLNNVARNRRLEGPVAFTGGVAGNVAVVEGFRQALESDIIVPPHHKTTGAVGAAMMGMSSVAEGTWDLGALTEVDFSSKGVSCHDCANECDIALLLRGECVVAAFGSRCGKWEEAVGGSVDGSNTTCQRGPRLPLTQGG